MPAARTSTTTPRKRSTPKAADFTPEIEAAVVNAMVETVLLARSTIAARPELESVNGSGGSALSKKVISYLKLLPHGAEAVDGFLAARKGSGGGGWKKKAEVKKEVKSEDEDESDE